MFLLINLFHIRHNHPPNFTGYNVQASTMLTLESLLFINSIVSCNPCKHCLSQLNKCDKVIDSL